MTNSELGTRARQERLELRDALLEDVVLLDEGRVLDLELAEPLLLALAALARTQRVQEPLLLDSGEIGRASCRERVS